MQHRDLRGALNPHAVSRSITAVLVGAGSSQKSPKGGPRSPDGHVDKGKNALGQGLGPGITTSILSLEPVTLTLSILILTLSTPTHYTYSLFSYSLLPFFLSVYHLPFTFSGARSRHCTAFYRKFTRQSNPC